MSTGEPLPAHVDEFISATAAATAAATVATTPTASSIFPVAAAGATAAANAAATIASVILDVGFVHGDAIASPHATLLSPPTWHR